MKEQTMRRILGLDLGTNSIGWAIVDADINSDGKVLQHKSIIDSGVRIFPEGIDPTTMGQGDKEKSKNAERREHRQKRRQFYRKRLRKIKLLEILIKHKMCPLTKEELNTWKYWNKNNTEQKRVFPNSDAFTEWLKLNPYELRDKALKKNITHLELGRVLYHMIQRRGFVSSRKEKDTGAIYKGKDDKVGISETKEQMGNRTLGEYLYTIIPPKGQPYKEYRDSNGNLQRARSRYTLRDMYIEEFYYIWQRQAKKLGLDKIKVTQQKVRFISGSMKSGRNKRKIDTLIEKYSAKNIKIEGNKVTSYDTIPLSRFLAGDIGIEAKNIVHRHTEESVLFWQRPLRSQKNLLGKCRFEHQQIRVNNKKIETGKSPCCLSHPEFELYRTYQLVNNIEYGTKIKLDKNQKQVIIDLICSKKASFKFQEIIKKLKLTSETFNYDKDYSVAGNTTIAQLKPLFDEGVWDANVNDIWHCFYFYTDNEMLFKKMKESYGCKCSSVDQIAKISLKDGYGSLSLKAIRNINPFLSKGYTLSTAVVLGGVKNTFGNDNWLRITSQYDRLERDILKIIRAKNAEGELIEKIKSYLINGSDTVDFGFIPNDKRFKRLYHASVDLQKVSNDIKDRVPPIPNLRNPLVQRSLTEMRHVVNALLSQYGSMDIIKIEMGRDLKNTPKSRQKMTYNIRDNQNKNEEAREKLTEFGLAHSRQNVRKYLLFKEIENHTGHVVCPYTGKTIRVNDLLGTGNLFQIEHIIPYSVSLDDSFGNITLCESNFNRDKGEKTPYEFYKHNSDSSLWGGATSWEDVEMRTFSLLPYQKAKRFTSKKSYESETFISRQLNDMRYISREAVSLMQGICNNVQVLPGRLTSELRHLWGLNNVLQPIKEIDVSIGDVDAFEGTSIPHWAIVKDDGTFVSIHKKQNRKPVFPKGHCLFPGHIAKEEFKSDFYEIIPAEGHENGKYWCKSTIIGIPEFHRVFNEKPKANNRIIVLKGLVQNGKFINERLEKTLDAKNENNGKYWGTFDVEAVAFTGSERPRTKKGQIALWGKIKEGHFKSYHYTCPTEHEEGDTWAVLNLNIEDFSLTKILREKPTQENKQICVSGIIDEDGVWISDENPDQAYATSYPLGKYWAVFNVDKESFEFINIINEEPKPASGEKVIEGNVWIDKQGEVRFDPKKNREDQRHHAIDALAIACTERSFLQQLSYYHARRRERNEGKTLIRPEFEKPWPDFRNAVQEVADNILISYYKNNRVLDRSQKYVYKQRQKHLAKVSSVRGQLHKETVFGKRTAPDGQTAYHIRKPITSLKNKTQVEKVVDRSIRTLIKVHLRDNCDVNLSTKYTVPADAFFKDGQHRIKLPNKNGEEVPIKKVRMREEIGNAKQLKIGINQFVNPRNNHHVLIYKDKEGELKENIVSFWDVTQRLNKKESAYQLPEDGSEIVTVMEINDMFLIGLPGDINIDACDKNRLSKYLYRVQKLSSNYYTFRHHLASTLNNPEDEFRIVSFKAWEKYKPIKANIQLTGIITKI